ncbi:hypothetical protein FXV83_00740 [Bradyrhizobium hipponense]|uniref:TfuA-like core domain-containing protein n=1 Tax=Bradyrhizobium hipponense TaxID=2605638 RepID=A0A5S4YXQ6_9BRAD|nr:TfuA-like protein [Bradyrhizobium hipponense]TYO68392.1 hypothetical protein FXV83_00740 [Bradyrhizobium hipponense]
MTVYVFLGPSLPLDEARAILDATYLPPVQQGDLLRLLERKPRHIGIIDGYFETVPAVWHKEILLALSEGVHVFGAASMGALRAAELQSFGMIGVGRIFQWFSDEIIVADDEVAVRHAPAELGYLPLNQSLVDIRDGCASAIEEGIIGARLAENIISVARALPFWERNCDTIAAAMPYAESSEPREIAAWLAYMKSRHVSLKARDAAALLAKMKEVIAEPWQAGHPNFIYEPTIFMDRLLNEIALEKTRASLALPQESAEREARSIDQLRRAALLRVVAREHARRSGWELDQAELAEKASALWSALGVRSPEAAMRWMERSGISEQKLRSYISDELYVARLNGVHRVEVERELALQMLMMHAPQTGGDTRSSGSSCDAPST